MRPGSATDRRRRTEPHWVAGPKLAIITLGSFGVETPEGRLGGSWYSQRPGQLLKYLVAHRHRSVPVEEIAEVLRPNGNSEALGNVRHIVHELRDRLEPNRKKGGNSPSSFIVAQRGGYAIDRDRVEVDADGFEEAVQAGLAARDGRDERTACRHFERAVALYRGDYMVDERYAGWAMTDRNRLRDLCGRALNALSELAVAESDLDRAAGHLESLVALDPFDTAAYRRLLSLYISQDRRSQAKRTYETLRARLRQEFGEDPDFTLAELSAGEESQLSSSDAAG